jgi:hypothetical protein
MSELGQAETIQAASAHSRFASNCGLTKYEAGMALSADTVSACASLKGDTGAIFGKLHKHAR